jgi:hypothetical protein
MKTDQFSTKFLIHVVASPFLLRPSCPSLLFFRIMCALPSSARHPHSALHSSLQVYTPSLQLFPSGDGLPGRGWGGGRRRAGRDRRSRVLGRPRPAQESTQRATRWVNAAALSPITPLLLVPPPGFPFARDPSKSILLVMVVWRRLQKFVPFCFPHRF